MMATGACVPVCLCACVPVCLCACVPVCLCACVPVCLRQLPSMLAMVAVCVCVVGGVWCVVAWRVVRGVSGDWCVVFRDHHPEFCDRLCATPAGRMAVTLALHHLCRPVWVQRATNG